MVAYTVVLTLVLAGAFAVGQDLGAAVAAVGIMLVYGAVLFVGRRSETLAVLGGSTTDERRRSIDRDATAIAGHVLIGTILVAFMWEVARAEDGQPWSALAAIGGVAYVVAVIVLRRLR
jgi:hypothetical protein